MQLNMAYASKIIPVDMPETIRITELVKPGLPVIDSIQDDLDVLLKTAGHRLS